MGAALSDFATKLLTPDEYDCNLCGLTYGLVSMKKPWKEFIDQLDAEVVFLHKDEFSQQYPHYETEFPVVLREQNGSVQKVLPADSINQLKSLDELESVVEVALTQLTSNE